MEVKTAVEWFLPEKYSPPSKLEADGCPSAYTGPQLPQLRTVKMKKFGPVPTDLESISSYLWLYGIRMIPSNKDTPILSQE
ncbi:conserved hypothetical protein [Ricinus communis]|uniref:Uncharacterized protein n=1 Tax=Ricinus communis TaxID=3988 RepID=B9SJZ0_RICCO|nr:conserved hypothetical protein [Ricinus communis]